MAALTTPANMDQSIPLKGNNNKNPNASGRPLSAVGVISLLEETNLEVCSHAINALLGLVDIFWYEVAEVSSRIIELSGSLPDPKPAHLLLAKLYFHLGDHDKSLEHTLHAGNLFDFRERSVFVETMLIQAVDKYIFIRTSPSHEVNLSLENLVERMIMECIEKEELKQAIGIAIESRRLDIVESCLRRKDDRDLLFYTQQAALEYTYNIDYQRSLLSLVVSVSLQSNSPDFIFVADCHVAMDDSTSCAELIAKILSFTAQQPSLVPVLFQIAFNITADATSSFRQNIIDSLPAIDNEDLSNKLRSILSGSVPTQLILEFMSRNDNSDPAILEAVKRGLKSKSSMHHSVLSCAHAIMHCGTTKDDFLRKNLEWLSNATNWAKFTASSSLGVIHKGQIKDGKEILKPYLPSQDDPNGSVYSEGGAFYALGLINARVGLSEKEYFLNALSNTEDEVLQHGICLGLGTAVMSSNDSSSIEAAKGIIYGDNAVSGEAAAISLGLILHSHGNAEIASEMLAYAHETQHEKIIRAIGLGIAIMYSGLQNRADEIINEMITDGEAFIRYGAMWTIATAWAGTSDSKAISRLLHTAVSDSDDNVRRAAVTALGFVLCRNSGELSGIIELLTHSFNPHVRYGAAFALGIAFAGTGSKVAIELIKPMCKDLSDFVRQGAYIALAMIGMQQNEQTCQDASWIRSTLESVATAPIEDPIAKFGAILAQGIMDAGGRNCIISLKSIAGHMNNMAVVGMALFCQFWYWYPLSHFISFALSPTALICVDQTLKAPKLNVVCKSKPSLFALPPPLKPVTAAAPKKLVTAILSTTAKAAARAKRSGKSMEIDTATPEDNRMEIDAEVVKTEGNDDASPQKELVPEPDSFEISNLGRVTAGQLSHVIFDQNAKYQPIAGRWRGEIIVVNDTNPAVASEYLELTEKPIKSDSKNEEQMELPPVIPIPTNI